MKVDVVICNYNESSEVLACIGSIKNQIYKDYRIFVVDNNSSDNSVKRIKINHPDVQIIENSTNMGFVGINSVLPHLDSEYTIILNNDIRVFDDWLQELVKYMDKHKDVGVCGSVMLKYNNANILENSFYIYSPIGIARNVEGLYNIVKNKINEVPYVCGGCLMIRTKLFKLLNGFDSDFFIFYEDVKLCQQVKQLGYKVVVNYDAKVRHKRGFTNDRVFSKEYCTYLTVRNSLMTTLELCSVWILLWVLPINILMRMFKVFVNLLSFDFGFVKSQIKAYKFVFNNLNLIYKKRKKWQKLKKNYIGFNLK